MRVTRCAFLLLFFVSAPTLAAAARQGGKDMALTLSSPAFKASSSIPSKFTCEGSEMNPALQWSGAPSGTRSYALIVEDPDAPGKTFTHWVLYNLPADATGIPEAASSTGLPGGAAEGVNDFKRSGYGAPCPPSGRHRYIHHLYALDTKLPDLSNASADRLRAAIKGHVLAEAELVGTYQKGQ